MDTTEARGFLKETFDEWKDDDALQWGAALVTIRDKFSHELP